jgi:hypothetical protein
MNLQKIYSKKTQNHVKIQSYSAGFSLNGKLSYWRSWGSRGRDASPLQKPNKSRVRTGKRTLPSVRRG